MVDVVGDSHGDAATRRVDERAGHELSRGRGQAQVVERDVEGALCRLDELRDPSRDVLGPLAAVRQRPDFDQPRLSR